MIVDDPTVDDSDVAYRRVLPTQLAENPDGTPRVSSATFKPRAQDDGALSIYLASGIAKIPATPVDCILAGTDHTLAALDVADVRSLGHGVVRDPVLEAKVPNPCDPAHGLIVGFEAARTGRDRQARALAQKARWPSD